MGIKHVLTQLHKELLQIAQTIIVINMKNKLIVLIVLLSYSISMAQQNKIKEKCYDDVIEISKDVFYRINNLINIKNKVLEIHLTSIIVI